LSIIGMVLTACCFAKLPKWLSMTLYVSLGWLGAVREVSWSGADLVPFIDTSFSFNCSFLSKRNPLAWISPTLAVLYLLAPSRLGRFWFRALFSGRSSVHGRWICVYDRTAQPVRTLAGVPWVGGVFRCVPFVSQPLSSSTARIPGRFGFHEIWHVAVVLAAASHWMLMYFFVLPWKG
jgi:predicted membrane channel-forming protein YqfA (hemolysin III family)